ncbi:hypothetical protein [Asticcacaulis taihuensis]|uniref:hypothetical protein n=1 Tax=Asticcacaulis taihuensis TaxID=260084 RepID=UPI003F7BAA07
MRQKFSLAAPRWDDIWPTVGETGLMYSIAPVRFRILPRGATWEVFRNTAFWGVFQSRTEADNSVREAMLGIFTAGGAAQVRFT